MENFAKVYTLIWGIVSITASLVLLLFRGWFLKSNEKIYSALYKKTGLPLFKRGAEEFTRPYMKILVTLLGLVFFVVGILALLGKI